MLGSLDRYLMRQVFGYLLAMTAIALLALLLERMLRLLELTQNSDKVIGYVSQMLVNLIPHYLGIALPAAFFLAVYLTFSRLNRDRELTVMNASGISLPRLMLPVVMMAIVLTIYSYRALIHTIANASFSAAVKEGTFVHYDGRTFMVDGATSNGKRLRQIFVYRETEEGELVITTAAEGTLGETPDGGRTILFLDKGTRSTLAADRTGQGTLSFQEFSWPIRDSSVVSFRSRGEDERELTLLELLKARANPPPGATETQVLAEFHSRVVRILSFFFLPILAAPLALGGGRMGQSYGLVLGLILLVIYEQLLQFGDAFVQKGRFDAVSISLIFFLRASYTVNADPLGGFGEWLNRQISRFQRPRSADGGARS